MRVLVLSDIHGNLPALEAVLEDAGVVDATWCLGDVVGYGAQPNEAAARLRKLPNLTCVMGNHDAAAVGKIDQDAFNDEALLSLRWTINVLTPDTREFLKDLPEKIEVEGCTLVHGSPRSPIWEYIGDPYSAEVALLGIATPYGLVGHTHHPLVFYFDEHGMLTWVFPVDGQKYIIKPPVIFNPGSVGQPRDRDPRAAYAIFDPQNGVWESHRVQYDTLESSDLIQQAGLPLRHAIRLVEGW